MAVDNCVSMVSQDSLSRLRLLVDGINGSGLLLLAGQRREKQFQSIAQKWDHCPNGVLSLSAMTKKCFFSSPGYTKTICNCSPEIIHKKAERFWEETIYWNCCGTSNKQYWELFIPPCPWGWNALNLHSQNPPIALRWGDMVKNLVTLHRPSFY